MAATGVNGWERREFLGGAALLAMALGLPGPAEALASLTPGDVPGAGQRHLLRDVSDIVIPRTTTPGAGEVGVGDFVILALAHGLEGTRKPLAADSDAGLQAFRRTDGSLDHLAWLAQALDSRAGGGFAAAPLAKRQSAVAALDSEAYTGGGIDHPWRRIKALILTGYYTSEAGGSQELRYELIPGRWDADIPLKPGDRAFSSDWTAVDFG